MRWGSWRASQRAGARPCLPWVIGRGVLPGGVRFVVLRTDTPWAVGSSVELLAEAVGDETEVVGHGWVSGSLGTGLTRVTLGNGCDTRRCRWARLAETA